MKTNTRVKITKEIFHKALLDILKEKPIHFVTVTELCQKAELNRGTFYAYYGIPDDVLAEIEDGFIDSCEEILGNRTGADFYSSLPKLYTYIRENIETLKILIGGNCSNRFLDRVRDNIYKNILAWWRTEYPNIKDSDFEFVFDTVYTGFREVLVKWIEGYYEIGLTELVRRTNMIISYCTDALEHMNKKSRTK